MLDYGINFNVEEGKKKALKEIEEAGKEFQKLLDKNKLKVNFKPEDFNMDEVLKKVGTKASTLKIPDSIAESIKNLRAEFRQLTIEETKAGRGQELLDKYRNLKNEAGIYAGTLDQAVKAQDKMTAAAGKSVSAIDSQTKAYKRQSDILVQLKSYAMNFLSVYGGIRLTKSMIDITGEFEAQRISLQAILRDAQKGEAIFEKIKTLAVISPYTFKDLVGYTKQLSAFSVPYNELYETTKMLADVSAGLGVDMSRIILAYGQVRSAAVLRGQELRQFTEAGIPLVDELAKKFTELNGRVVETGEVFDLIGQRKVSFEMVKDIFSEMSSEGGKFYNMQEKLADTLKGKVANLTDAFQIMMAEIGEKGSGILKGAIDSTRWLMENYDAIGKILLGLVATYGTYRAAIIAASVAENIRYQSTLAQMAGMTKMGAIMEILTAKTKALNAVIMKNPYAIAAAALIAVVSALILFRDRATAAEKAQEALNKRFKEQEEYAEKERSEVTRLINVVKDEISTRTEKQLALEKLQRMYPDIFGNMDVEALKIANTTKLLSEQNEQLEKRNNLSNAGRLPEIDAELERLRKEHGTTAYAGQYQYTIDHSERIATLEKEREGITGKIAENERAATQAAFDALSPKEKIANLEKANAKLLDMQRNAKNQEEYDFIEKQILQNKRLARSIEVGGKTAQQEIDGWLTSLKELDAEQKKINADASLSTEKRSDILKGIEERRKELEELLKSRGWKEPKKEKDTSKKDAEKAVKDYLDNIQKQVDEYGKKLNIWKIIYERTGEKPKIDFGVEFDGEPNLEEYIKRKMQEIGKDKLNLDLDFLTADFKDIIGENIFDEQTGKVLQDMFSKLRDMYVDERLDIQDLYDKYATYIIKKQKLDEKYQKERERLIKSGADKEILDEQFLQYTKSANQLATEFAENDLEFNKFINEIADKSIEELGRLLMQIDLEMAKMIESGGDPETIAVLRAKIVELEKLIRSQAGKGEKAADSYKDWKKLQTVLSRVDRELQDIGDGIGGTAGEMVKFAGGLTTSTLKMINSIVELGEQGILGIKLSAKTAASAIKALETASVVLAVISAVLQVYNAIKGLFDDKEQREYINKLEEDRNKIARDYNRILLERIAIEDNLFGGNDMQNIVNTINAYSEAIKKWEELQSATFKYSEKYAPGQYANFEVGARKSLSIKTGTPSWFQKNVLGKGDTYENLEEWVRKNMGSDLFGEDGWLNLDVAKEVAKLDQLEKKTKEYIETLISVQEAKEEFESTISEMVDNVFGDLGNSLTDSIVEGFRNGSLAAEDFKDDVIKVLEDVSGQMLRMLFLQQYIDEYKDSIKAAYSDFAKTKDQDTYTKKMMESTADFFNSASNAWSDASDFLTMYKEEAKKHGFNVFAPTGESNLTGVSKNITQMSEDTALVLEGTLNSMRLKIFEYYDYMKNNIHPAMGQMLLYGTEVIANLQAIALNTRETADNTRLIADSARETADNTKKIQDTAKKTDKRLDSIIAPDNHNRGGDMLKVDA